MAAEAAKIAGALVLGHAANVFASYWIHRAQHSGLARGWLRAIHERAHHPAPGTEPSAGERAAGHLAWAGGVAATAALYLAALPGWMAWLWIAEGAALAGAVYWLHREYDQPQSELERFGWFRRCRSWHRHHHAERSDSNYSVGGPLLRARPRPRARHVRRHRGAMSALRLPSLERLGDTPVRACAWRAFYGVLARRFPTAEWVFMELRLRRRRRGAPRRPTPASVIARSPSCTPRRSSTPER